MVSTKVLRQTNPQTFRPRACTFRLSRSTSCNLHLLNSTTLKPHNMKKRFRRSRQRNSRQGRRVWGNSNRSNGPIHWAASIFSDLCIHLGLKFFAKSCPDFEKYDCKSCPYAYLKVYGVAMAQYEDNDQLLVQTFPRSLTGVALTWFTKLDITKSRMYRPSPLVHGLVQV